MRLGILGGTFDPPHVGHLILAEEARQALELEQVLFVPAGAPWRKAGRELSPREDRLAMVQLAVGDSLHFAVSILEIEREGPSYTAETLAALHQQLPADSEIFFIVGQDSLADLPNWRQPQRIISLARLAVAVRTDWASAQADALEKEVPGISQRLVWLDTPRIDISSTAVRDRVRQGLSIRDWVPPAVEEYIRQNKLYVEG
ncbi:MAG: nicotinate-nucleotide adenylyltransferase [Dehalococcoidia bacterium]|nr:MAG: nicotinate-nucleotide adenylyltransferase [Dehalococcoidia bacterium]